MTYPEFVGGYNDLRWCRETKFGSGAAKAIVWRIATDGGSMHTPLDYRALAAEHEFTIGQIRAAVARLIAGGFARITPNFHGDPRDSLILLTPGRLNAEAHKAEQEKAKASERAAKIALRGGQVTRAAIPAPTREFVFDRDGRACRQCGATEDLALDHIHPWSLGGPDTAENLQVLCRPCNSRKGDKAIRPVVSTFHR